MNAIFRFDGGGARGPARVLNGIYGVPASAMAWTPVVRMLMGGTDDLKALNLARGMSPGVSIKEGRGPAFEGCIFRRQHVTWMEFSADPSLPRARYVPEFASTAGSGTVEGAVELFFPEGTDVAGAAPLLRKLAALAGRDSDTDAKLYLPEFEHTLAGIPVDQVDRYLDELLSGGETAEAS